MIVYAYEISDFTGTMQEMSYRTAQIFEKIDKLDEFLAIHQYFSIKIFHLVSYLSLMNL